MCNGFEQEIAYQAYLAAMEMAELGVPTRQSELDLPPNEHVHIRDAAAVMRPAGNAIELATMRFGFPPPRPKASPVFNFRSEGRRFADSRRCLIPASAFFEYTGSKYPKTRHRFTLAGRPFLAIAGIWRPANDNEPPDFTMLTTDPGPDVEQFHNRQVVILPPELWSAWLYLTKPEGELLRPLPANSLEVESDGGGLI